MKPPEGLKSPEAIQEWWQQFYVEHLGAFHEITWHRIILDGNHSTRDYNTSPANALYRGSHHQESEVEHLYCSPGLKCELQMGPDWNSFAQVSQNSH
jgi:hypothetical protein